MDYNKVTVQEILDRYPEDFSAIINTNTTSYSVYDHWLRLATKYFDIGDVDPTREISLLKAGLFGYFNEVASHEVKNAMFHRNVLYDEHFLNSASFPESIFNFAKLYNVPIETAHPAHMLVELEIKKDDLLNSSLKKEVVSEQVINVNTLKTYELVISKNNIFTIDRFNYLLPFDVIVTIKQTSELSYSITAMYDMNNNYNFPFLEEITSPYIKVYQDTVQGNDFVFFALDIYQMQRKTTSFSIMSEDISDNLFYTSEYTNQLAYFEVEYIYKGKHYILNQYFNNTYNPENSDEKYCYYTFLDDDKLQISFSALPNSFRPRYNSELLVHVYTTLGSLGNFTYKGEIRFNLSNNDDSFSKLNSVVIPITDSTNGKNKPTTREQKQLIIQELLTRDNLITDADLEIFFTNINNNNSINGSFIKFMKKQDDFLKRIYNSFLLMREQASKVIPTNTARYIELDENSNIINLTNNNYLVYPEHAIIACHNDSLNDGVFDPSKITYEFLGNEIDENLRLGIVSMEDKNNPSNTIDHDDIYYINPYLIKIDLDPVLKANYYKMDINKVYNVSYTYSNPLINSNFVINKVAIEKEDNYKVINDKGEVVHILRNEITDPISLSSDTYKISFDLNTSETFKDIKDKIEIRGILISKKTNQKYGYFQFYNFVNDIMTDDSYSIIEEEEYSGESSSIRSSHYSESLFIGYLSTSKEFDKDGKLYLKNSLYDENGEAIDKVAIDEDLILKIGVLYKNVDENPSTKMSNDKNSEFASYYSDQFVEITGDERKNIDDYILALSTTTNESVNLYKNLTKIMSSIVTEVVEENIGNEPSSNNQNRKFKVEMIPLIGAEYYLYNYSSIYNILDHYINILESTIPRLENNTTIDLKFYNSYGPSLYHYATNINSGDIERENTNDYNDTEAQSYSNILTRVDVLFDFTLHLYEEIDDIMDAAIKKFISDFVEACNIEGIVPISNLIRLLELNFPVIRFIEYNGLSGNYKETLSNKYQKIESRTTDFLEMSKQEIIEYVPEYINLKKGLEDYSLINSKNNTYITLNKKYEYIINIKYIK